MGNDNDVAIVGGGITGAALAYVLARYSAVRRIICMERAPVCGAGNSSPKANSQTLHRGDIEAWYSFAEAVRVRDASAATVAYLEQHPDPLVWRRIPTMLLAVGDAEIAALEERFWEFREAFPALRFLQANDIAMVEPAVLRGRAPGVRVAAIMGEFGYAVDFQRLARQFLRDACAAHDRVTIRCGHGVQRIARAADGYTIHLGTERVAARAVAVCAGGFGLSFAHALGLGREYAILPVAGCFATVHRSVLRGKVYAMQAAGVPFTRPHGDADVADRGVTRFGPIAVPVPCMDRHRPATILAFLRQLRQPLRACAAFLAVVTRGPVFRYACWSAATMVPFLGRRLFVRACRRIVPTLAVRELDFHPSVGGTRPQLVHTMTRRMVAGEARIVGDGIVITIAPSPGASVCLATAARDAAHICEYLGTTFDRTRFAADHCVAERPMPRAPVRAAS